MSWLERDYARGPSSDRCPADSRRDVEQAFEWIGGPLDGSVQVIPAGRAVVTVRAPHGGEVDLPIVERADHGLPAVHWREIPRARP